MQPLYNNSITYMSIILLILSLAQIVALTMIYRLLRSKTAHIATMKQDIEEFNCGDKTPEEIIKP